MSQPKVKCLNPQFFCTGRFCLSVDFHCNEGCFGEKKHYLSEDDVQQFLKYLVFSLQFSLSIFLWNPKIFQAKFF